MTVSQLITKIREEKPNSFTDSKLYGFINEIEAEVAEQLGEEPERYSYTSASVNDGDEELMAPSPYDRLYESWMKAKIDYANEEYDSYSNNQAQHIQDFRDFTDYVIRADLRDKKIIRIINTM